MSVKPICHKFTTTGQTTNEEEEPVKDGGGSVNEARKMCTYASSADGRKTPFLWRGEMRKEPSVLTVCVASLVNGRQAAHSKSNQSVDRRNRENLSKCVRFARRFCILF